MKTYLDAGQLPMADAMDKLPGFDEVPAAAVISATGTHGQMVAEMRSQKRSQTAVAGGPGVSQPVAVSPIRDEMKNAENQAFSRVLSQPVVAGHTDFSSEGDGVRTRNLRIDSPVL